MLKRLANNELPGEADAAGLTTVPGQAMGSQAMVTAELASSEYAASEFSGTEPADDFVRAEWVDIDSESTQPVTSAIDQAIDASQLFDNASSVDASYDDSEPGSPWSVFSSGDTQAFLLSLVVHTILILSLALIPILSEPHEIPITLTELPAAEEPEQFEMVDDIAFSEEPEKEIGSGSLGETGMALSTAAIVADVPDVQPLKTEVPVVMPAFNIESRIQQSTGLVRSDAIVQGFTGVGTTGTDGAVDRITYEILNAMEERPTLVVWFFDQSGSLIKRRQEIRDRFDRIYKELGIVREAQEAKDPTKKKMSDEPLLTSVFAFGDRVTQLTEKPTADMKEIRGIIDSISLDQTGNEKIFSAFYLAVEKYKGFRTNRGAQGPERNVLFIAVTDERGDDADGLDATIRECRKYAIPVYVIGVPAPFGREYTYIKYVDPDPKFDQSPQWAQVDQGPESLLPERVKLGYRNNYYEEPVMDSGFGPYALSRLTYETGGIYFTVHPNRQFNRHVSRNEIDAFATQIEYFFDPEVMAKYRPDYISKEEYLKKAKESPLRQILIEASRVAAVETLQEPKTRFVRRDDPSLVNELTQAQQAAARLDPQLSGLLQLLAQAQEARNRETSPRWLAGYDLAVGTVLAHKVRAETYNLMLAKVKRGMAFENPKNNTWLLKPADEISVGSKLEKEAETAREILKRVGTEHTGTPWAVLANNELRHPIGWKWVEEFTDLNPPRPANRTPNANPQMTLPQDDKARMLQQGPPKRPIPKL